MKINVLKIEFVFEMPKYFQPGVLYFSIEYEIAGHLCACGCGNKVWTPINVFSTDKTSHKWGFINNKGLITLSPSIGNFALECKSHYFIKENKVVWC